MTALILMLIWLSQVSPVVSDVPLPRNVRVNSSYFHHMLQWEAGVGTPPGVYYKVTVHNVTGPTWKPVVGCQRVQHPLVCNLTVAFSSDPKGTYFARVVAVLDKHSSEANSAAFVPARDTHLDLPLVTVTSCGPDLCLSFDPPRGRPRDSYDYFEYEFKIQSTDGEKPRLQKMTSLTNKVFKDLPPGREYCASIRISDITGSNAQRSSNFSQPKCLIIPSHLHTELPFTAGLCLSLIFIPVLGVLYYARFIYLKKLRLPLVLTSIRHTDEFLHVPPFVSLLSILNVKPTAPSSGKKKSSQAESSDSDEESVTDVTEGGRERERGGVYKLRVGTNLLSSSSSSSSSSLSAPLSTNCFPTNQNTLSVPPDVFSALPEAPTAANTSTSTADSLTAERTEREAEEEEEEEEEGMREGDSRDVNLLTLTFGNHKEKEEEPAPVDLPFPPPVSEETSVLLSRMCDFNEAAKDSDICSDDEEEEDEYDGANEYMRR